MFKSRLATAQKGLSSLHANLKTYQDELQALREAKDSFQKMFNSKNDEIKRSLSTQLDRILQELKRHINHHRNENNRVRQQLQQLTQEKVHFQKFLRSIRERLEQIQRKVGE